MLGIWMCKYMRHNKYVIILLIVFGGFLLYGVLMFLFQKYRISIGINKDLTLGIILAVYFLIFLIHFFKSKNVK